MAFVEFVIPMLKQDAATKAAFLLARPILTTALNNAKGLKGRITSENGVDIDPEELRPVLGIEWEKENNLSDFLNSNDFKTFAVKAKPLSSGSEPSIQLYKTDLEPTTIFSSALTEVFRVLIIEDGKVGQVQLAWKQFVDSAKAKDNHINTMWDISLDLERRLFVGVVGYRGAEVSLIKKALAKTHI